MPTSGAADGTSKKDPPPSSVAASATPSQPQPPAKDSVPAAAASKTRPKAARADKQAMGGRFSSSAGSAGKAPSTASASSTHTASTVPADVAEAKSRTLPARTSGVAGFLRRKPAGKGSPPSGGTAGRRSSDPAAGPSGATAAAAAAKKPAKKSVGSSLRSSLFKRGGKSKAASAAAAAPASGAAAAAAGAEQKPVAGGSPEKERPPSGRSSPEKRPASSGSSSPPKSQRSPSQPSSKTAAEPAPHRKTPSPAPGAAATGQDTEDKGAPPAAAERKPPSPAGRGRGSQALTPARKEALKKQWFTEGQPVPAPESASRRAPGRAEVRPRPGRAGETVGPPAKASRVHGAALSSAAGKSGTKAPPKPRPASPKKHAGVGAAAGADGMADFMDAMSGFKPSGDGKGKETKAAGGGKDKEEKTPENGREAAEVPEGPGANPKSEGKGGGAGDGLLDLMGAMEGFSPDGSKADKPEEELTKNGKGLRKEEKTVGDKTKDKAESDSKVKKDSKGIRKTGDLDTKTIEKDVTKGGKDEDVKRDSDVKKETADDTKENTKNAEKTKKESETGQATKEKKKVDPATTDKGKDSVKEHKKSSDDQSASEKGKPAQVVSGEKSDAAGGEEPTESAADALEPKADKTSTWRPGDEDSGELGLGGISHKDREERAKKPRAAKGGDADLDFLAGLVETAPKAAPKAAPKKEAADKEAGGKDEGLGDLMDLAKGFDMAAVSAAEPVAAAAEPPAPDMDKFLDFMDLKPAKPSAPPLPAAEVAEEPAVAVKTWRTGDGDDEKMVELMNKPRDRSAPAQAADWDIDDLLTDKVVKQPQAKPDAPGGKDAKAGSGKDDKGLSDFEGFIGDSLAGKPGAGERKPAAEKKPGDDKADKQADTKKADKGSSDKGFSSFDDFLTDSLSSKDAADEKTPAKHVEKKEATDKKSDDKGFSAFDDFLGESLSSKEAAPVSSAVSSHEERVAAPKKVSGVDTSPPPRLADEEVVSAVAFTSQTTAKPGDKRKPASDKHVEKPGNTRGSVPDHGHGVRDLLYHDSDKTGRKNPSAKGESKPREPAVLDDLIRPAKASSTSSAPHTTPGKEEAVVAETSSKTEASGKSSGKKTSDKHVEKLGDTRGSVPDHGHGVRDVLYDDSDKTGRKSPSAKKDSKPREPAVLDDLVQPRKAATSQSAPGKRDSRSPSPEAVVAETAHQSQASAKPSGKKTSDKHVEKLGDTRGSVPDHGHGVRDVLYDDSDKTGRKSPSAKKDSKPREPAVLDDLVRPRKVAASHASPGQRQSRSPSPEAVVAETAHQSQASAKPPSQKTSGKHIEKEGSTRGSVPDHGHGVRDLLYDDSDRTGRKSPSAKGESKPREPAVLDDLIRPAKASSTSSAPHTTPGKEEAVVAETSSKTEASGKPPGKKTSDKHVEKLGDTRGSVPDHGHGVRDVLYDDSDKTGRTPPAGGARGGPPRQPAPLEDLIRPAHASHTASAPPGHAESAEPEGPAAARAAAAVQAAPPPPQGGQGTPPTKSLSLAGMTDPDQEDDDDGEELRRLIASTEALHAQLHGVNHSDSKQAQAVQEQTGRELEQLERQLERKEQQLEAAGRRQEVQVAKEGLRKVKLQLDATKAAGGGH